MKQLFSLLVVFILSCNSAFSYTMSNAGKELIKQHEKCSLVAYWDSDGYSIGYGHHKKNVYKGMKITQAQANKYFNEDIKEVEDMANFLLKNYKCKFSQGFFDGLCDLIYNCGIGNVKKSDFYKRLGRCRIKNGKINENDFNFTVAAVKTMCITAKGHIARRHTTHKLMLS